MRKDNIVTYILNLIIIIALFVMILFIKELKVEDTKLFETRLEQRILDMEKRYTALENRVFKLESN